MEGNIEIVLRGQPLSLDYEYTSIGWRLTGGKHLDTGRPVALSILRLMEHNCWVEINQAIVLNELRDK